MSLGMYDHMFPMDAARAAWVNPGPNPAHHEDMKREVRRTMPLLARALDRVQITPSDMPPPGAGLWVECECGHRRALHFHGEKCRHADNGVFDCPCTGYTRTQEQP